MSAEDEHVHDLPQVYQKPDPAVLIQVLESLAVGHPTFNLSPVSDLQLAKPRIDPTSVPRYLTSIVSSSLSWVLDDDTKERIWELASLRLSERSGRNAMPSMTRSFQITDKLTVQLHEPSLTGDNLGLKTWTSSLLLSRQLPALKEFIPERRRILELGAGTGLVGITAACLWEADVLLTDLPEVIPNLDSNLLLNREVVNDCKGKVAAQVLNWSDRSDSPNLDSPRFQTILAADPIYSSDHPRLLVDTISRWLKMDLDSRVLMELPLRGHYEQERSELRIKLKQAGLKMLVEGNEVGYDDWYGQDGKPAEVECWWSIWSPDLSP